ncbi:hypothetical protein ACI3ER_11580 [Bacillus sp. Wb]
MEKMIRESIRDYLFDLYDVGTKKSLGYLPVETVTNLCGSTLEEIVGYAELNKLQHVLLKAHECDIHSGAIYLYHEKMLKDLLNEYREVLEVAGVPIENPVDYIKYISNNTVYSEKYPEAYMAIGKTFNDYRFQ